MGNQPQKTNYFAKRENKTSLSVLKKYVRALEKFDCEPEKKRESLAYLSDENTNRDFNRIRLVFDVMGWHTNSILYKFAEKDGIVYLVLRVKTVEGDCDLVFWPRCDRITIVERKQN